MGLGQEGRVRAGIWLYNGQVECRVEIWRRGERPGTGDYEDDPEIANDRAGDWYEVRYEPVDGGRIGQAGGGFYSTLEDAVESVRFSTHGKIKWNST